MSQTKAQKAEQREFIEKLRALLKPGDTVFTTVKRVARSGMSRCIDVHIIRDDEPQWLSYWVAKAIGQTFDEKTESVRMGSCGMDMGFALVYALSQTLFPNGFECIGEKCPSNDHSNNDRNYKPHHHNSGGYALRQKWL